MDALKASIANILERLWLLSQASWKTEPHKLQPQIELVAKDVAEVEMQLGTRLETYTDPE